MQEEKIAWMFSTRIPFRKEKFAQGDKIPRRQFWMEGQLCTESHFCKKKLKKKTKKSYKKIQKK